MLLKITFEDHGQDFLEWQVNGDGEIVQCTPFQSTVWCGHYIINRDELAIGGRVEIFGSRIGALKVKYPIENLEMVDDQGQPIPEQPDIDYH